MASSTSINVNDYVDMPYSGILFNEGLTSLQLTGIDAIKNVIKMYLLSQAGDYGRNVTKGGLLFSMVGKQLTQTNANSIQDMITTGLSQFTNIVVNNIVVSLDIVNTQFKITIVFSDIYNKFTTSTTLGVPAS